MQVTTRDVNIKIVNLRFYEVIHTVFIGLGVSVVQEFQMLKIKDRVLCQGVYFRKNGRVSEVYCQLFNFLLGNGHF